MPGFHIGDGFQFWTLKKIFIVCFACFLLVVVLFAYCCFLLFVAFA
jgi:hypothetical protein